MLARHFGLAVILASLAALSLTGCTAGGLAVGGAAAAGVATVQERTLGRAIDDKALEIQINHRLLQADEVLFRKISVEALEGRVLLLGAVPKPDDRIEASRLAWETPGVREVMNEVQVTDRSGIVNYFKDAKITTELRLLILRDRDIRDINYSIETVNGIVYLLGIAQDKAELDKLTRHARNIAGVEKVISHVRLRSDKRRRAS
ncbi:MAG TPA: BON domain-containing protein [Alphaproteobacteria bacterium]|jgi:osmotically-inducible protein OsmY|nr:BON domain-containing protein [Alphaproteobacteria bacterium]HJM48603.1 BON domain-containing protein [Alphaproteobacteria bacterium]